MTSVQSIATSPPTAGVTHVRHRHGSHFTVVGNHLAQHRALSATAIGLAVHIQSLPDGAVVGIKALAARFPESEYRIAAALRQLEAAGYLSRTKHRAPGQRIVTRTTYFECPGAKPAVRRVSLAKPARSHPLPAGTADAPARELLAGLRAFDPRLMLSQRAVTMLAPGVTAWLERSATPAQVVRTLVADLPDGMLRRPAGLLAFRLREWLPPQLPMEPVGPLTPAGRPAEPAPEQEGVVPLQDCDGCDRVFRSHHPGHCRDCRTEDAAAAA